MSIQQSIQSIIETTENIIKVSQGLSEELISWKPAEDKWSILEVLSHVEEATPYWLGEIQRLVQAPGSEWGRGLQHEGRLAAVAGAGKRPVAEVLAGIKSSEEKVQAVLGSLSEEDLQKEAPSRNPRFGTKPMHFIVEHLMVEHLAKHLGQINRNIGEFQSK